jgi:N-acetylneuraminic acid mutarotase
MKKRRFTVFGSILISLLLLFSTAGRAGVGVPAGLVASPTTERNGHARAGAVSNLDTWVTRTSMPTARDYMGVVAASNGKIYVIGGKYRSSPYCGAWVEEYDPTTDTWTTRSDMPTARSWLGAAEAGNGKIYAIGGYALPDTLATVEEYDPATDTWTTRASMPAARNGMGVAAASNGKIYAIGGWDGSSFVNTVQEYDPATDTWTTRASMPTARAQLGVVAASNGKIYAIGGRDGWSGIFVALDTVQEYDPATDTWATRASISLPRYGLGVAATSNGKVYAIGGGDYVWFGGYEFHAEFAQVEEYDPATDTWTTRSDMPTGRNGLGAAAANNGKIYAIGGSEQTETSTRFYDIVEEYSPSNGAIYLPLVLRNL